MTASPQALRVAIGADFLTAFAKLPGRQQGKVGQFIEKFRANPRSPGINYESIRGAADPNLKSVRIDQDYRGVVLQPDESNVYLLLWVDRHDDAYDWACRRRFRINPHTGGLQVIEESAAKAPETAAPAGATARAPGLFDQTKDKHLLRLGVPEELLPLVRSIQSDHDLEQHERQLPQEAVEALYMLAMGFSLEEVYAEREQAIDREPAVDPDDFEAALANGDTQRRFHVLADSLDLGELLKAPLEKWRVFLHPSQRRLVTMSTKGPARILGGAGTGKTVVAMHRAKHLAEEVFASAGDRILFTTFTRNLAEDIRANLTMICSQETMRRIEVVNLDAWAHQLLQENGYKHRLLTDNARRRELWGEAALAAPDGMEFPDSFYEQEWAHVVQAHAVSTEHEYLRASRVGRGQGLSRLQRKRIWPVFEEYRALLTKNGLREFADILRDARILLQKKGDVLGYRAVIVDEAQDMSEEAFRLVRQIIPPERSNHDDDLFIVGDAHQRIYAHRVTLGRCGIETRGRRSRKLRLNYRTTEEIGRWATALLEGVHIDDLDGGEDDARGYRSLLHGTMPELRLLPDFDQEVEALDVGISEAVESGVEPQGICLVCRTQSMLDQYEAALQARGRETFRLAATASDSASQGGIRMATMHRVKGLEFDVVLIAGTNADALPLATAAREIDSPHARGEFEIRERSLLYVAATRARKHVLVTAHGKLSPVLARLPTPQP
ncbi:MAG: AAA family ATPase [Lentisphaeria bacterium]|jgi:superfamily I DNA/RNA helicase|nr:AAA family ATPase [Lentisphaeria bacterium]